jgi:aspartate-semialdehyde dehydrogenase
VNDLASRSWRVAVVGATGLVGKEILSVLAERHFPAGELRAISSEASAGDTVAFGERQLRVDALGDDSLQGVDIAFFAAGRDLSAERARGAASGGARVIDLTGCFADDPAVPLIAPEVNGDLIEPGSAAGRPGIVTAAAGSLAALAAVLKPLDDAAHVRAVTLATFEPASGIGGIGVSELSAQTMKLLNGISPDPEEFPHQIAFNCFPEVGSIGPDGITSEEHGLATGLRRVLGVPDLRVFATAVRIPVFFGLAIAVTVELERPLSVAEAQATLRAAPGLLLSEGEDGSYVTLLDAVGTDAVHVGRLRVDPASPTTLGIWVVIDCVRKGAAVNAVAIAERMLRSAE